MKFMLELHIDKPRAAVWQAFDNPENMKKWQPSLTSIEQLRGTQGRPGSVSKLTYKENEREFSLVEKITDREEPQRLDRVYENNFADNTVKNTFIEQGKKTLWVVDTEFKFKTLIMKVLGAMMKKNFVA